MRIDATRPFRRMPQVAAVLFCSLVSFSTYGESPKGESMSYREATAFLKQHTQVVELTDGRGACVAICPELQGRVMTSTCGGPDGISFGFVHRSFLEAKKPDPHFNNFGGEERLWLSPEGGPFSLWFKPGVKQEIANWYTPPALNEGAWACERLDPSAARITTRMKFSNTSATDFDLAVKRDVRLLDAAAMGRLFGRAVGEAVGRPGASAVAYETANAIENRGPALCKDKGLVSIWILGMMNSGPQTVVIVPYRAGPEAELGPVVRSDYFGVVPADRLKVTPEAVLFRADANWRSKIGTSQRRAKNILGSIDFQEKVITLVQFTMPDDPTKADYMNNLWGVPQKEPYVGDVANSYNDGPSQPGQKGFGAFYEIESLSPAKALATGESLVHCHRTAHIQADDATLARLAKEVLGVDLVAVRAAMLEK